jgi:putative ABC transport system permease protein
MNVIRVAFFLAFRQLRGASIWATLLIVLIMILTFLNLIVVGGILVGLVQGSSDATREYYSSDIIIEPISGRQFVYNSQEIIDVLDSLQSVEAYSARYITGGTLEANYNRTLREDEEGDVAGVTLTGIDPSAENQVTGLASLIIEGRYLDPNSSGEILISTDKIEEYTDGSSEFVQSTISGVGVGDKVRVRIGDSFRDMEVVGILDSKVEEVGFRSFILDRELREAIGRTDLNRHEIAISLVDGATPEDVKRVLFALNLDESNLIQTWEESQGTFFKEIQTTFQVLGDFVGSIGLFIASITVFIIIFINAVNRRKYIGIMKAIGIKESVVELSYVMQSFFYASLGSGLGVALLYLVFIPFFQANPIDFPFSDGVLSVTQKGVVSRVVLLHIVTVIAGYIPARMISQQNTVDSILGR